MITALDREELIAKNMPLARGIARRIASRVCFRDVEDATGDAYVGLVRAAGAYDPDRGIPFVVYAAKIIAGFVLNGFRSRDPVSERVRREIRVTEAAIFERATAVGAMPSQAEIASEHPRYFRALAQAIQIMPLSLDGETPVGGHFDVADAVNVEDLILDQHDGERVRDALERLDERSKFVILAIFADDKSALELADEMNVSRQRIHQIKVRALAELRNELVGEQRLPRQTRGRRKTHIAQ